MSILLGNRFSYALLTLAAVLTWANINVAVAADCDPGWYTACAMESGPYGDYCECECEMCSPAGYTSNGEGVYNYDCPNMSPGGNTGCYAPFCADYGDCPAGVGGDGKKCNVMSGACPSGSGCTEYEVCNVANGAITYEVTGSCHLEEVSMCQPNSLACNQFPVLTQLALFHVVQTDQSNDIATWNDGRSAWDTKDCKLNATSKNISTINAYGQSLDVYCDNMNMFGVVSGETDRFRTKTVFEPVYYTLTRHYCAKCHAGYLPKIQQSPDGSVYLVPAGYDSSSYGVLLCDTLVTKPYYAPGCTILYPLNSGTVPNECRVSCPDNMETVENGATSENDCLPRGVLYEDATGFFKLGTDSNLCN